MRTIDQWEDRLMISFFQASIVDLTDDQVRTLGIHIQNEYEERRRKAERLLKSDGVVFDKDAALTKEHLEPADEDEPEL